MTINKSQGQSFEKVGVYLENPVFAHGQLYVAFSRVRSKKGLKIFIKDGEGSPQGKLIQGKNDIYAINIVYKQVLNKAKDSIEGSYEIEDIVGEKKMLPRKRVPS